MKLVSVFGLLLLSAQLFAAEPVLSICDDEGQWPPFFFKDETKRPPEVKGILIDVVNEILKNGPIKHEVELIPWKRCLEEVKNFETSGQFEMLLNATYNTQRQTSYLYSDQIYSLQLAYFFSLTRFPNGLNIQNSKQLQNYKLCGVRGFNYQPYKLASNKKIDTGAANFNAALKKVDSGRCDILLSSSEPILASQQAGLLTIPSSIRTKKLNYLKANNFHFVVSKGSPRGKQLINLLNQGLKTLKQDGTFTKIVNRYLASH